jgi:ABC-type oligopeptide transport system ATPase subunit
MKTSGQHSQSPLLDVRGLSLSFHKQKQVAIDRVSFRIPAASTLGLVGASGSGKSSIARAIMRLVETQSGEILFKGQNVLQMDPKQLMECRQRIQLVFQDPSSSLSPKRTVEQTLLEPMNHFAIGDTNHRKQKIKDILRTVGLDHEALKHYPHQFSSGQQQRIAIARAMVTNPELLIADEAVSSLDVSIQAQILQLIQSLQKEHGVAFLFISHDLAVIRQIADDVAVMFRGQLLEHCPADLFFSKPAHPYSQTLLSLAAGKPMAQTLEGQWQLERNLTRGENRSTCVYARNCPDKMPVCDRLEPASHNIRHGNQNALELHCVKCHLYDEVNTYDSQEKT